MQLDYSKLDNIRKQFGDSYYLLDINRFEKNYDNFLNAFQKNYAKTTIGYSYKTNYTPVLGALINKKNGYAEVVSYMEYELAIKIGVKPNKIIVNGPYKTKEELTTYLSNGSIVNLDSLYEVEILKQLISEQPDKKFKIGLRCNFSIKTDFISRFGFDVESADFQNTVHFIKSTNNLHLEGIHCHFPDRNLASYAIRASKILAVTKKVFEEAPGYIDIGGGYFGNMPEFLAHQFNTEVPTYKDYAGIIANEFNKEYQHLDEEKKPLLILEPGSALVADTLLFFTSVIDIKKVQNKYIAMTSGSKMNMGSISSGLQMPMTVFSGSHINSEPYTDIDISGYTCIESDYLYKNFSGLLHKNDILMFENIGSYSIVFKPPFIMPNFPILMIDNNDNAIVIKRKENNDDIFRTFNFDIL